ncbi:Alpha-galactosidase [Arthrobotrys entomopaga]|nr:Alpha-galactosidase [Arthrobotrys entomopaga]
MWAAIKSPLIMGHDVTKQSSDTLAILTNRNILDLSQGTWSVATRTSSNGNIQIWQQNSPDKVDRIVIVLNSGTSDQTTTVSFSTIFANDSAKQAATYTVTELWTSATTNNVKTQISVTVKKQGVWVGKFHPSGSQPTTGQGTTTSGPTTTTSSPTRTTTGSGGSQSKYGQCGGIGWTGPTACSGSTCQSSNPYYYQCL